MIDHYRRIAESTSLPVLLYNNPVTCGGVKLEVESVARLAEIPNVVGIKDSSGDLQTLIEMIRVTPKEKFAVFQGRDTLIAPALQYGAKGAVPGTANIAPELCVAIYDAMQRGDFAAAQAIQSRLSPLRIGLAIGTAPGAIKAAMNLLGFNVGPSRSPIAPLPAEKEEKLRAILKQVCG